jgi:hypothetical protein
VPKKKLREIACTVLFVIAVPILNRHGGLQPLGATACESNILDSDECRRPLGANLFMPAGANPSDKFPVLLEYLPYCKDVLGRRPSFSEISISPKVCNFEQSSK